MVKRITPSWINIMTTPPSTASSTPSYIRDIAAQFQQNPLPDFTMLGTPDTFKLNNTYRAKDPDSPEAPTPPPITVSPSTHESLIKCMQHDIIHERKLCPE